MGPRFIVGVGVAALLVGGGALARFLGPQPPETPANAVLDFGNDVVLGDEDGAWDRLCSELKADALGGPGERFSALQAFERHVGNLSTKTAKIDGDEARVPLSVRPFGVPDDSANEQWVALLVRERGKWRVCGYERAP